LLIDQPEDDLDKSVIQEIIQNIWKSKQKRQIIFASHDANLVVNGDAELVIHCDYESETDRSKGEIANLGSIDVKEIRDAITTIMEGGQKAFDLRKNKYGF
jgi:type III restriction enzyme